MVKNLKLLQSSFLGKRGLNRVLSDVLDRKLTCLGSNFFKGAIKWSGVKNLKFLYSLFLGKIGVNRFFLVAFVDYKRIDFR